MLPGMSQRPNHNRRPGALPSPRPAPGRQQHPEPEALLLDQIVAGVLDPHLTALADAIRARSILLQTVSSARPDALTGVRLGG
jgi:hypothetical protein